MTREELIARQNELNAEFTEIANRWIANNYTRTKSDKKREWEIIKENTIIQRELDKLDGKTYDCDKWITKFVGNSYVSLKDARLDLINQIKNLHGVEVGECSTGVVGVTVYTEFKIYHYTIHAHYRVEKINIRTVKGLFGIEHEEYDTRTIYQAWCSTDGETWSWRY